MPYCPAVDAPDRPDDDFPPLRPFGVPGRPPQTEPDEDDDHTPPRRTPRPGGPQPPATPS